jgi:hypothetical protein
LALLAQGRGYNRVRKLVLFSFLSSSTPHSYQPNGAVTTASCTFKGRGYNRVRHFHVYVTQCVFISCWDPDLIERRA